MEKENTFFTTPDIKYKDTYLSGRREFQKEGKHYLGYDVDEIEQNFEKYLEKWTKESKGIDLVPGRVPQTNFWLMVDGVYVGRVSVRHFLNDHLLKLGGHIGYDVVPSQRKKGYGAKMLEYALGKAKEMGIEKALLTCDEDNVASRKIIEKYGGVLENIIQGEKDGDPKKCRFWINLI